MDSFEMDSFVLDNIDAYISITELNTYRLLYVNGKYAEKLNLKNADGLIDYSGKYCWKTLYNNVEGPCEFCPAGKLAVKPDKPYYWESYDTSTGRYYQNISRIVTLPGGPLALLTYSTNITGIKEQLITLVNRKNDYLSRMSHEILTPMNAIIGMSKIAGSTGDMGKIKNCLLKIDEASKQLMGIINNIMDISRLDEDRLEIVYNSVFLEKILMEVCAEIMARANEKTQDFQVVIDRDAPAVFRSDELRLSQVLMNLLLNAVKFTPVGGKIRLRVSMDERDGGANGLYEDRNAIRGRSDIQNLFIRFTVSDTGIGIPAEDIARMFTAYEQVNGTMTRTHGGIGLGLAISRKLVRLLGGDISVESELNKGSSFSFGIVAEAVGNALKQPVIRNYGNIDLNVLYADTNKEARDYFIMMMGEFNIRCACAEDGFSAIDRIQKAIDDNRPYTVVFVDLRMPHMNGIETVRQIKDKFGERPIPVLMAGVEWNIIEQAAQEAGIRYFLSKPLFPSNIVDIINLITRSADADGLKSSTEAEDYGENGESGAITPDFSAKRILLVDDVEINSEIIISYLEGTGATLDYAGGGAAAVKMFSESEEPYDMILMDLHMPDMDGCEAAFKIRSAENGEKERIPILALTAEVFEKDVERCKQSGMNGHIRKPVSRDHLLDRLAVFFSGGGRAAEPADAGGGHTAEPANADGTADEWIGDAFDEIKTNGPRHLVDGGIIPGDMADYRKFLPVFDVEAGLKNLRNIKKLYIAMLVSLKNNPLFGEIGEAMENTDINLIINKTGALKNVIVKLCLPEMTSILEQIEAAAKHKVNRPELLNMFKDASFNILNQLDDLADTLNREANS